MDIVFSHKPSHFPVFLSYLKTDILDTQERGMIASYKEEDRKVDDRRLDRFLAKKERGRSELTIHGIERKLPGKATQTISFERDVQKCLLMFDENAIFPSNSYVLQSGEIVLKNGRFKFNLKLQKRVQFGSSLYSNC
jgi:hypothetical protein